MGRSSRRARSSGRRPDHGRPQRRPGFSQAPKPRPHGQRHIRLRDGISSVYGSIGDRRDRGQGALLRPERGESPAALRRQSGGNQVDTKLCESKTTFLPLLTVHGRLCIAGPLRRRRDMLAEFPPTPPACGGGVGPLPAGGEGWGGEKSASKTAYGITFEKISIVNPRRGAPFQQPGRGRRGYPGASSERQR